MLALHDAWQEIVSQRMTTLGLTRRKKEVVWHLIAGYSTEEIANALYISESTVKNHIWKIYDKLDIAVDSGAPRRMHLVMFLLGADINKLRDQLKAEERERV